VLAVERGTPCRTLRLLTEATIKVASIVKFPNRIWRPASASKVAKATIANFELGKRTPYDRTLDDLVSALEAAGVEFTNGAQPGVRFRKRLRSER
jgi:hypothetical protein